MVASRLPPVVRSAVKLLKIRSFSSRWQAALMALLLPSCVALNGEAPGHRIR